jgi:aminoglycoside phosphotransferase (APT) family kinase protein
VSTEPELDQLHARAARAITAALPGATLGALESLPGGISSLTFAAEVGGPVGADGPEHGRRVVVKVAPPGLKPVRNRDVLRQARILRALAAAPGVRVPRVLGEDDGTPPLFVMSHVPGESWEPRWDAVPAPPDAVPAPPDAVPAPPDAVPAPPDADAIRTRFLSAAEMLAHLHTPAPADLGLTESEPSLTPAAELERWGTLYGTAGDDLRGDERALHDGLAARVPSPLPPRVTHGDYRLGNLLLRGARVEAIIDWELWALGDPRTDLGWLIMFCDPAVQRRSEAETVPRASLPAPEDVLSAYAAVRPASSADLAWFTAYAHYKLASTMSVLAKRNRRAPEPDPTLERAAQTLPAAIERGLQLLSG